MKQPRQKLPFTYWEMPVRTLLGYGHAELKDKIVNLVGEKLGISPYMINSNNRTYEVSLARHMSIYLLKKHTELSLTPIGRMFNRDHTSVIHSVNRIGDMIDSNKKFRAEIGELNAMIENNIFTFKTKKK